MADSSLDALLTTRLGNWRRPEPSIDSFQASLQFVPSDDRSGKEFSYPILTAISHGTTTDNTGGIVTLKAARPGQNKRATLDGVNLYIRETLSYSDLMKMANGSSQSGDAASYDSGPEWTMYSMMRGLKHASEIMSIYGAGTAATIGCDIGVIDATPVASGGPNWNSATDPVVRITRQSWAKRLWLQSGSGGGANSGMLVDVYNAAGDTLIADNIQVVGVVDSSKCQVRMTSTAATATGAATAVTAGHRFVPAGTAATSALGVAGIMGTVGTFAGIDNTAIPEWRPQQMDAGGAAIDFDMLTKFAGKLAGNGAKGSWDVWASHAAMSSISSSLNTYLRWNDGAGTEGKEVGTGAVTVVTDIGRFFLRPYGYIKQGEFLIINRGEAVRIGAAEERKDGIQGTGLALELPDQTGSEMRAMCQFAPLLTTPFYSGRIYNAISSHDDQPAN